MEHEQKLAKACQEFHPDKVRQWGDRDYPAVHSIQIR